MLANIPSITPIEKRGSRYYKIDGIDELYPSVTTVTGAVLNKPALVPWAKRVALENMSAELYHAMANDIVIDELFVDDAVKRSMARPDKLKDAAADLGTRVHAAIDAIIKGEKYEKTPDIETGVNAFLAWRKEKGIEIVQSEVRVFSKELEVAGCVDAIGRNKDGGLVVLDWKTSRGVYLEMAYQVGGYALCLEELLDDTVAEAWIIRFPKNKEDGIEPEPYKVNDLFMAMNGFTLCRSLFRIKSNKMFLDRDGKPC